MKKQETTQGRKPLCIIGTAESSKDAPYDMAIDGGTDYVYDIWGINTALVKEDVKRLDVCFEMHPKRYWGQQAVTERLKEFGGPVYMQDHYKEIPNSVAYPRDEIKEKYHLDAMGDNLYVTTTIVWMLLLAIEQGYTDISIYGVHMAHETEYAYQRSSCSWVLGIIHGWILEGKPYKLYLAPKSEIFKAEYEYGFDEPSKLMVYLSERVEGMDKGIQQAESQINNLIRRKHLTEGAIAEVKNLRDKVYGYK